MKKKPYYYGSELREIFEMGAFFQKNPKIWVPIIGKITPEHGYGSWAAGGTSPSNPNLSTPLPGSNMLISICVTCTKTFQSFSFVWRGIEKHNKTLCYFGFMLQQDLKFQPYACANIFATQL